MFSATLGVTLGVTLHVTLGVTLDVTLDVDDRSMENRAVTRGRNGMNQSERTGRVPQRW
jgi:hypothetical protein